MGAQSRMAGAVPVHVGGGHQQGDGDAPRQFGLRGHSDQHTAQAMSDEQRAGPSVEHRRQSLQPGLRVGPRPAVLLEKFGPWQRPRPKGLPMPRPRPVDPWNQDDGRRSPQRRDRAGRPAQRRCLFGPKIGDGMEAVLAFDPTRKVRRAHREMLA